MEFYTISAPPLGGAGPQTAAGAAAAIGLAAVIAAGAGRLGRWSGRRRRARPVPVGRAARAVAAPLVLGAMLTLELAMLRLGGDPFTHGATAGAGVLGVTFLGFAAGVARASAPRPRRARRRARGA